MPTQIQTRRGTTTQHSTFTGAVGELTVDTDKKTVVVHDGTTAGGAALLRENQSNLPTSAPTQGLYNAGSGALALATNSAQRLLIDANGNVNIDNGTVYVDAVNNRLAIGSTAPGVDLEIGSNSSTVRALAIRHSSAPAYLSNSYDGSSVLSTLSINNYNNSNGSSSWSGFSNSAYGASAIQVAANVGSSDIRFLTSSAANTNPTEKARLDSSGRFLVGTSSAINVFSGSTDGVTIEPTAIIVSRDSNTSAFFRRRSSNGDVVAFLRDTTAVGTISVTTTATAYNTSSDYRLKENIVPLTGATSRVNQLQVHRFNFIADPTKTVDGFLAHEAQAVVPEAVTGERDAVDYKGNPVYQGIDQSKLVPLLTAALQEALAEIEALKARVTALEP